MNQNVDDLFLLASQGNKKAYEDLFDCYMKMAMAMAINTAKIKGIYTLDEDEVYYKLVNLFDVTIRTFAIGKVPFKNFAASLLKKRIVSIVVRDSMSETPLLSLDKIDENGFSYYDVIPSDDYSKMMESLNTTKNKQTISSKRLCSKQTRKRINQILELKSEGYKRSEICEIMGLSVFQYRYLERVMRKISGEINTIEMK